jgi:hypothetical protein
VALGWLAFAVGAVSAQDAAGTPAAIPEPEFKNDAAKKAYDKGKEEFANGKYAEASKSFKTALSGAKEKKDKDIVDGWINATKGGPLLVQIRKLKDAKVWNEAYDRLLAVLPKYRGTPLEAELQSVYKELDGLLFEDLENFNQPKPALFSKQYGKTFIHDPKLLANGTTCLHWQNTPDGKAGMLKIKSVPEDWTGYNTVEFWVKVRVGCKAEVVLMSTAVNKEGQTPPSAPGGEALQPILIHPVVLQPKGEWQYVRLPLKSFQSQGGAALSSIVDFRIQIPAAKAFDFFIDEIRLRRANPAPEKGAGAGGRKGGRS